MKTKLETWFEMSQLLKETKAREAELRRELCGEYIGTSPMDKGRVTVKGHDGHLNYTAVQALNFKLDQAVLSTIWKHLSEVERTSVLYKPSLVMVPYKKLPEDSLLHEAVTATLSMPTLKAEVNDGYQS